MSDARQWLHDRLETFLKQTSPADTAVARELLYELRAQEIELEMQYRALRDAQNEMEASRGWYLDLYEHAPVAYVTLDGAGNIAEANVKCAELLGRSQAELRGKPLAVMLTDGQSDALRLFLAAILSSEPSDVPQRLELSIAGKDGRRMVELEGTAMRGGYAQADNDELVHCRCVIFDVTERKRAEDAERQNRQLLTEVLDSAMDAIINLDANRRVVFFNRAAEWMFGCSALDAAGQPLEHFIPEHGGARKISKCGRLQELRGRRTNGEQFPIEVTVSSIDLAGGPFSTVIVRDISERIASEVALAESEAQLRYVTEAAEIGIWDWNVATDRLEWSPQCKAIFGIPATEAMSYGRFIDAVHPEDRERVDAAMRGALAGGGDYDIEYRTCWPNGEVRWIHAKGRVSFGPQQQPLRMGGIAHDVTHRKVAETLLIESERRFRNMADIAPAMLWMSAPEGTCSFLSQGWYTYTGQPPGGGLGYGWLDAVHADDRVALATRFKEANGRHEYFEFEYRVRRADSVYRWVINAGRPRFSDDGEFLGYIGSVIDISERKFSEQRVRDAALHDPLTRLPNRSLVFEYGNHLLAAAQRRHGSVALLFVDLDQFKAINDQYGHEAGDVVLQEVAKRLGECTRQEDLVGRLGGDEFVILLPHVDANRHRAVSVAQHVLERIAQPIRFDGADFGITPSIGIACYPEDGTDIDALIRAADLAMYQSKRSGRANYHFYTATLEEQAEEALELESRLKHALKHGGLVLHYQPVIDISSGRPIAAEALVRLPGAGGETIAPDRFLPIAESAGMIAEVGDWVVAEAGRQYADWEKQGLRPATLAINVSSYQFKQKGFVAHVGRIIAAAGLEPSSLQIDLIESAILDSEEEVAGTLRRLKALGVHIALDHFGSGFCRLGLLARLPFDLLKVDRSFVEGIEHDRASQAVARAIVALGHTLDVGIVGEGIESEAALQCLRKLGCNQAQGFAVSRPLPAAEFAQWYSRHAN